MTSTTIKLIMASSFPSFALRGLHTVVIRAQPLEVCGIKEQHFVAFMLPDMVDLTRYRGCDAVHTQGIAIEDLLTETSPSGCTVPPTDVKVTPLVFSHDRMPTTKAGVYTGWTTWHRTRREWTCRHHRHRC